MQAISDFFYFNKESIYLGLVIAASTGAVFVAFDLLKEYLKRKFFP